MGNGEWGMGKGEWRIKSLRDLFLSNRLFSEITILHSFNSKEIRQDFHIHSPFPISHSPF